MQLPTINSALKQDPGLGPGLVGPGAPLRPAPADSPASPGAGSEFVAVDGGGTATSTTGQALVLAYVLMWGLLFAFVYLAFRRQQRLETRIADLERAILDRPEEK